MGKKSKRVRTKQTKEEYDKVKATYITKLKIGLVSGLEIRITALKAIKKGKILVKTGSYTIIEEGVCVRKKYITI